MTHLLKIEYAKVKDNSTFWTIIILYMVMLPMVFFGLGHSVASFYPDVSKAYEFPKVWNFITYMASWTNLLLGVLVVSIICNEIAFRTQRQNIIDGLSRKEMILSKFYLFTALAVFVTLYTFLLGMAVGVYFTGFSDLFSGISYIGYYFLQAMGYFAFAFFFAFLLKNPALAIVLYILTFIFKFIFTLILGTTIAQFSPINAFTDLVPFPFFQDTFDMIAEQTQKENDSYELTQIMRSLVSIGWIAIFVISGYFIVKKRDL
jgi:ABC-2 type transport system permease protein